jgi:hypothetical protein
MIELEEDDDGVYDAFFDLSCLNGAAPRSRVRPPAAPAKLLLL